MNLFKLLSLLVVLLFLAACSSIKSINQLGQEIYQLNEDKWNGTWVTGEGSIQLEVVDTTNSEVSIMFIEKGKIQKYKVFIRKDADNSYMNLIDKDNHYFIAKFKKTRNQIIVWLPALEMMQKAVNSKAIAGIVSENKNVLITAEKKQLDRYFFDNKERMLFEYEEPVVFRKLIK